MKYLLWAFPLCWQFGMLSSTRRGMDKISKKEVKGNGEEALFTEGRYGIYSW